MYHLQPWRRLSQPWPQSPRGGDHLKNKKKKEKKGFCNDKSENNPPTWLPTEMKKWNECCYYYLLHQWYIKLLQRAEGITNVILSDPQLMSSYPQSDKPETERERERERDDKPTERDTDEDRERAREKNLMQSWKTQSHTREMSDSGGWEKPWLHRCVESQHARAAGGLVNTQRLETDNSPRLSNPLFLVFS